MFTSRLSVVIGVAIAAIANNSWLVSAIPKISTVGSKFFTDDGDQFFLKGRC